jgi:hypothetical protein
MQLRAPNPLTGGSALRAPMFHVSTQNRSQLQFVSESLKALTGKRRAKGLPEGEAVTAAALGVL